MNRLLSNKEWKELHNRVDEIYEALSLCDKKKDSDVILNLGAELSEITSMLIKRFEELSKPKLVEE